MALDFPQPGFMADEEMQLLSDAARRFFERAAPPDRVEDWRTAGQVDRAFWKEVGEAGFLGASVPTEYGGQGGDFRHDVVLVDEVQRAGLDGFALSLHNVIILPYIQLHGTEDQKRRWLPGLSNGDLVSAIAMSEPGAGSDLQAIRTTAVRDGDDYVVNGSKTFISNGQLADLIVVVAKTDPAEGAKGISLLVVEADQAKGFRRGRQLDKIGLDAQDTSELFFDDVRVPADNLLGGIEGRGFAQLMAELPRERMIIALGSQNMMEHAIEVTIDYTRERQAFGKPLLAFQNTQFKLAEMKAKARVGRAFINECLDKAVAGELDLTTAAMAKLWATETEWEIVDACLQLHGGYGYINDYPIARMFRNARVSRIYGGSSEIMKLLIARSL